MLSTPAIALSGMSAAQLTLRSSAHNIANLGTEGFHRQGVLQESAPAGGVTAQPVQAQAAGHALETDLVTQLQAKHGFLANLSVFRSHDQMMGSLLDLQA